MPTKFYDFRKLDSLGCTFNMIVGARGVGKTYGASKRAIKRALKSGDEFVYLRRTDVDLKEAKVTFFDEMADEFPDWDFRVIGKFGQASPVSARDDKRRHWTRICHFVALSQAGGLKSKSYVRVRTIIFDEFIGDDNTTYLPNEAATFVNFFNTVDRYRDRVKVYMLANAVSIANPYFIRYKIRVPKDTEIVRYASGFIGVHFPKSIDFAEEVGKTKFGRFLLETDPEYAKYAIGNEFSDNHAELIAKRDPAAAYRLTLFTKHGTIALWYSSITKRWYGVEERPPSEHENTYTTEAQLMKEGVPLLDRSDALMSMLRTAWRKGRVWFSSPEMRNAYLETFK